jgi:NAD(P)-dependent dehydrogenase (short-subunit alcohol dehydrogenase family)
VFSIVGMNGFAGALDYGSAKAAVTYLSKVLALEWANIPIRVNSIAPGFTRTPMIDEAVLEGYDIAPIEGRTPLGRMAHPDEIARSIEFLLSESPFVTGAILAADGGWTASGR